MREPHHVLDNREVVVEDIDATAARVTAAGYRIVGEIVPFVDEGKPVRVAYFEGPDGVGLTLLQKRS